MINLRQYFHGGNGTRDAVAFVRNIIHHLKSVVGKSLLYFLVNIGTICLSNRELKIARQTRGKLLHLFRTKANKRIRYQHRPQLWIRDIDISNTTTMRRNSISDYATNLNQNIDVLDKPKLRRISYSHCYVTSHQLHIRMCHELETKTSMFWINQNCYEFHIHIEPPTPY